MRVRWACWIAVLVVACGSEDRGAGSAAASGSTSTSASQSSASAGGAIGAGGGSGGSGAGQGAGGQAGAGGTCTSCDAFLDACVSASCPDESELCAVSAMNWNNLETCACPLCPSQCTFTCTGSGSDAGCGACLMSTARPACLGPFDTCTGDM